MRQTADRNLLFGILALQMDAIDRDQLIDAMHRWAADKNRSLGEILVSAEALDDESRRLLEGLMDKRIERHEGDVQESLGSFATLESSLKEQLLLVDDVEVTRSVNAIPLSRWENAQVAGALSEGRRFSIIRFHAQGGLGEVYVADDCELHRRVALKMMKEDFAGSPDIQTRFAAEAEITASLEHPNIVPVYGLGQADDGRPYYAMKFIHGESLRKRIDEYHQRSAAGDYTAKEHSLALRALLGHFVDTCHAVEYAHSRGVIHRDLKPANVMLGRYGETLVVDWGLAKAVDRDEQPIRPEETTLRPSPSGGSSETVAGQPLGTLPYASPEQIAGQLDQVGPASDVYSLGASLFVLLTGEPPFKGTQQEIINKVKSGAFPRPRKRKPQVPAALEAICLKAMAYKPENRYRSPTDLAADITAWLADEAAEAYRDSLPTRLRRWVKRHRGLAAGTAATLGVTLIGLAIGTVLLSGKNRQLADLNRELASANTQLERKNDDLSRANAEIQDQYRKISQQNLEIQQQRNEIVTQRDRAQQNYETATRLSVDLATRRGQWNEALVAVNRAIAEEHQDQVALRLEKVRALYGLIRTEQCRQEIETLAQLSDKAGYEAEIALWHGDMLLLKHDETSATDLIQQAIELGLPPDEDAYARALLASDTQQAVQLLEKAIAENPFHQRAYHSLVADLIMLGQREGALDKIEVGRILFPDDANFHLLTAWLRAMEGNGEEAAAALQAIRPLLGDDDFQVAKRLFRGTAEFVLFLENWEKPLSVKELYTLFRLTMDFRKINTSGIQATQGGFPLSLEFRPGGSAISAYTSLLKMLSWKTALTLQIDKAVADDLTEKAKAHPDGFLHFFAGLVYLNHNEVEAAVRSFEKAAELPALVPHVQREASYCLCMTRQMLFLENEDDAQLDKALDALRKRLALGPLRPGHAGNVLGLCLRRGQFQLARTIIRQQLENKPDDSSWLLQLADVERRDGHLMHAIRLADTILQNDPESEQARGFREDTTQQLLEAAEAFRAEADDHS